MWKCLYCGGKNANTDRSCPSCGCMQQDAPKPKKRQATPRPPISPLREADGRWIVKGFIHDKVDLIAAIILFGLPLAYIAGSLLGKG